MKSQNGSSANPAKAIKPPRVTQSPTLPFEDKEVVTEPPITGGHAHRFRDTFAISLLLKGVDLAKRSVLLGHSSIKVTERHYSPWVKARQEQLEADVRLTWAAPPAKARAGRPRELQSAETHHPTRTRVQCIESFSTSRALPEIISTSITITVIIRFERHW